MSIFKLTNTTFDYDPRGLLGDSVIGNDNASAGYEVFRYPPDVGTYSKGHYMVIHINEQVKTQFSGGTPTNGDRPTVIEDRIKNGNSPVSMISDQFSKVLGNLFGNSQDTNSSPQIGGIVGNSTGGFKTTTQESSALNFVRTIRRTTDTIVLYMPDTMNFDMNQQYSTNPLTGGLFMGAATAASIADAFSKGGGSNNIAKNIGQNLGPFATRAVADAIIKAFGNDNLVDAGFTALTGLVTNPALEMIYSSPEFRKFSFEFVFYPRSEAEAKVAQDILALFYFHQSPEINKDSSGFFLVPPSEFDIKFYYMGKENPNIPKISTCVLENINVDYAPNGWAAYETPDNNPEKGKTGMPVGIRLRLTFAETEIMTKSNFKEGRDSSRPN